MKLGRKGVDAEMKTQYTEAELEILFFAEVNAASDILVESNETSDLPFGELTDDAAL